MSINVHLFDCSISEIKTNPSPELYRVTAPEYAVMEGFCGMGCFILIAND